MNNNLVEALLKAQRNIQHAIKDARAQFGEYSTVNSVIDAVKEPLNNEGIVFIQRLHAHPSGNHGIAVETVLMGHGSEISSGILPIPAKNNTAQDMGSCITYGRRYSLSAVLGLGAVDDDGQASTDAATETETEEDHVQNMLDDLEANGKGQKSARNIYENHFKLAEMAQDHELAARLTASFDDWVDAQLQKASSK